MYLSEIVIENFRQFVKTNPAFTLSFKPGVTAIVGENDSGKTAIIDAIRYALLTRDTDHVRVQPDDFHVDPSGVPASESVIRCRLSDLSDDDKGAFAEHLTYEDGELSLYVYWRARNLTLAESGRRFADVSVRSGKDGAGANIELQARQLLAAAYLKPLRDAEREMAPGNRSRLSQVLLRFPGIDSGRSFEPGAAIDSEAASALSLSGLAEYFRHLVNEHEGVQGAQSAINERYLSKLALGGENLHGRVSYIDSGSDKARLRQILERLQLNLLAGPDGGSKGRYGLGSNNLLYMACELLLLGTESEGLPLLLIEEPEAHLQPQRQLRLMEFLETAASIPGSRSVQVVLTTHSPNLASKIPLNNLVLLQGQRAFAMAEGQTMLEKGDYRFLQRFLDSTRANLFFARGLIVVEGDAEAIVIPALARMLGCDLTTHGVSILNVGGTGLRRYARIFQRKNSSEAQPSIPVACLADLDVMPNRAPEIFGMVEGDSDSKWDDLRYRRWRARRDLATKGVSESDGVELRRAKLRGGDSPPVKTFVADNWTLEYDLAKSGLAEEVYTAALLAKNDDSLNEERKSREEVIAGAEIAFKALTNQCIDDQELLCIHIYRLFKVDQVSKAVTAQYLVEVIEGEAERDSGYKDALKSRLPRYIADAIAYVSRNSGPSSGEVENA
ncbi:ATP-dependent nuclease [Micromonospora inaquosa]|uniref:ATP-dependent endonuclease n=1 Tax=Micromonospora inaquosa TaxID=2203716 RepID=A0A3N9WP65_9ACTN|nr:AAA family ATPase [Micromonospora inaquosa]RQX02614.1 ATP-dependent endonuclease [Micromonospora inaquosa]